MVHFDEIRQLINDGFTALQAEQIASYRYSPLGTTNAARMQRVFSNANWLYGFNSIGPSGKNVERMLTRYLRSVQATYIQSLSKANLNSPKLFMSNLSYTTASVMPGKKENIPACFLSEDGDVDQQLSWIDQSLHSARSLEYLPLIQEFIDSSKYGSGNDAETRKAKVQNYVERLKSDQTVAQPLLAFVQKVLPGIAGVQASVANFMADIGWISQEQLQKLGDAYVKAILKGWDQPVWRTTADQICSLPIKVSAVDTSSIPAERFNEDTFIEVLRCLHVVNSEVVNVVIEKLRNQTLSEEVRVAAAAYLTFASGQPNPDGRRFIFQILDNSNEPDRLRGTIYGQYLSYYMPFKESELQILEKIAMEKDRNISERGQMFQFLRRSGRVTEEMEISIISETLKNENWRNFSDMIAGETLGIYIKPQSEKALNLLVDTALNSNVKNTQREIAISALSRMDFKNKNIARRLVDAIVSGKSDARYSAARALSGFKTNESSILLPLLDFLVQNANSNDGFISQLVQSLHVICRKVYMDEFIQKARSLSQDDSSPASLRLALYWSTEVTPQSIYSFED